MDSQNEKQTASVEGTDSLNHSTFNDPRVDKNIGSDSDGAEVKTYGQGVDDDQYPHGLKLILLAGASLIAVFLIALDQVTSG